LAIDRIPREVFVSRVPRPRGQRQKEAEDARTAQEKVRLANHAAFVTGPPRFSTLPGVDFMDIRPLHDRLIVRRLDEGEQKIGGIIIPDSAKEKPQQGRVVSAGAGKLNDDGARVPLDVKTGDLILFGKYSGQDVKLDGEELLIMREDDVLAVIDGDGTTTKA
jgi:chaperonin GroES